MLRKALVLSLALAMALVQAAWAHSTSGPVVSSVTVTRPGATSFGGPFSLIDHNGRRVSSADFRGTPMLIYFGYTNCTDACPLDTQAISNAVDLLDQRGVAIAPIFITVDPQRDTPARLGEFLSAFHSRFVGLTGSVDSVMQITTAYGASGEGDRVNDKADGRYDVLHASIAYLMGRHGEFLDILHLRDQPEVIAETITNLVNASDHRP